MKKPVVAWVELSACSGCGISFLDNYQDVFSILDKVDLQYCTLLTDNRIIPEKIDLTIIEGGCAINDEHIQLVRCLRDRSSVIVAMGACAETGGVLNYAEGNQMPMPELDAFLPIHTLIEVDYAIPGCPPAPEAILKFLEAYLSKNTRYLAPYKSIIGKSEGKIRDIVKMGLCVSCGICGATCPTNAISFVEGKPVIRDEYCILCGECYFQCPRSFFCDVKAANLTSKKNPKPSSIGKYIEVYSMRTTNHAIKRVAQSGGAVTSIFSYGLDNKLLDGVLVSRNSEDNIWMGEPIIVTSSEGLLQTAGARYSVSPILYLLKTAITSYGLTKLGIVGLPCQHEALRKLCDYPLGIRHVSSKIALRMGLFCTSNFRYNAFIKMLEEVGGIRPEDVNKVDIGVGNFNIYSVTGEVIKIPLKVVHNYEQESCKICPDFTSEFADISVGSIGSSDKWSTVIVRTEQGKTIIDGAIEEGYLQARDLDEGSLSLIEDIAFKKNKKGNKYVKIRNEYGLLVPFC